MAIALALLQLTVLRQPSDDTFVGLLLREALEPFGSHAPIGPDHGQGRQIVVAADVEIFLVVTWRDFQRTRAEVWLDSLIGDHRYVPSDHGHDNLLADRVAIARVVWVHAHGNIG